MNRFAAMLASAVLISVASPTLAADKCKPDCGIVTGVDRYKDKGEGSALGAIAGGVAGGLLGNQVGGGTGKTIATVGGAAGGAYAGYKVEEKLKTKNMIKVTVKMDNGQQREFHFPYDKNVNWGHSQRVRVIDGQLTRYTGK
jgi:outer membrane lipoprotein SlyB